MLAPRYFAGVITFGAISQASYAFSVLERALGTIVQQFSSLSGLAAETQVRRSLCRHSVCHLPRMQLTG